ncbi:E3 ubiquitin-protein ligase PRT1 isoform X2 [Humulus lupulus]|uniref:E3 ubiquitin-protein ligase PRT1 isoform X2 n=1 Tax=Humulus lupulus TaxID=3486 RepID=UPI002B402AB0|nr:E3 ubiquitin-protein ligase PRT1 isoform X2 [Humulus lupulus]
MLRLFGSSIQAYSALNPYTHFPTICQLLHRLLQKMYPLAYKKRELQTLEEEKKNGYFSPQLDGNACNTSTEQDLHCIENSACEESCPNIKQLDSRYQVRHDGDFKQFTGPVQDESCGDKKQLVSRFQVPDKCLIIPEKDPDENRKMAGTGTGNEMNIPKEQHNGNFKQVTVEDVLCATCKQLLFRPMVLNCGHVHCESCLVVESCDKMITCQVCQSLHPKGFLNVCLELNQFLEQCFPREYAFRRDAAQLKKINFKDPSMIPNLKEGSKKAGNVQWWRDPRVYNAHFGVGCDYCGMYPIIGERYRCKDCLEKIGFDLCSGCYNTTSKLPGRFNQQHTPDHKFENIPAKPANTLRIPMAIYGSTHLVFGNYSPEISEDDSTPHSLSGDAHENAEFSSAAHAPASSGSGEEDDRANSGSTA